MHELLEFIVESIVRDPDAAEVVLGERRGEPALEVRVERADRGLIIGRGGRTIRAIETVLAAAAARMGQTCPVLEVAD